MGCSYFLEMHLSIEKDEEDRKRFEIMKYIFMKCVGLKTSVGLANLLRTGTTCISQGACRINPHPVENPVGPLCRSDILYVSCLLMECTLTRFGLVSRLRGAREGHGTGTTPQKRERMETAVHIG